MKKIIVGVLAMVYLISCGEQEDRCAQPDLTKYDQAKLNAEIAAIEDTLSARNIPFESHFSGVRYNIVEKGDGRAILNMCNRMLVHYRGRLLNTNTQFESTYNGAPTDFRGASLSTLVPGWQFGIPLIRVGGKIDLYIPATLAYGDNGVKINDSTYRIPPGAPLHFTIELFDVQ